MIGHRSAAPDAEQSGTVRVSGRDYDYTLVRVRRRRHVHLLVDDEGRLVVRAPWRCGRPAAEAAIREHEAWVSRALERGRARRLARPRLVSGAEVPLLDERLRLAVQHEAQLPLFRSGPPGRGSSRGSVERRGRTLVVRVGSVRQEAVRELLTGWYRAEAAARLPARLDELARELRVRPRRVTIRAQRTRWGSCTSRGTVSLNWRLLLLPSPLSDYVLVHELCHLRHMDHSARFWAFVATAIPDWAERRAALDAAQGTLPL